MKTAIFIIVFLLVVFTGVFAMVYGLGHKAQPILGKSWQGYESGKCYQDTPKDPFAIIIIEYIIDIHGEYYQYQFWLSDVHGYGDKMSQNVSALKILNFKEVPCPKHLGIF
jgi:hypothetical protein